ncbi:proline-rich transmembrane protein 3 [Pseudophryne corroboree]|uniref:proline-rich transmembrane protein 3 n=1 Tax=Pseudophryne corroboree TaxID=495146 RepID=UPI003081727E
MADCVHLHMFICMAILAAIESSTTLIKLDITKATLTPEVAEGNSRKNFSEEASKSALDVQNVSPWEGRNNEEVSHTKPPGRRFASLVSVAAFMPDEKITDNIEENVQKVSNEFPYKDHKKLATGNLQKHNKMSQRRSSSTVGTSAEEAGHTLSKIHPTISKISEPDSESETTNQVQMRNGERPELSDEKSSSQALQLENYVDSGNVQERKIAALTTVHPVVSTISLTTELLSNVHTGDDGPFTQIQKLQIESGDEQANKALLQNIVESQNELEDDDTQATPEAIKEMIEDNFLGENLIPKVYAMQPTERYHAAFRTTDGYSTLVDSGPEGNEVISADVEFLHADSIHYQKDGNTIQEDFTKAENDTEDPYFSPLLQAKKTLDAVVQVNNVETSTDLSDKPHPSTPLPTLPPYFMEDDLPHATVSIRDQVTLEAKARMETERILMTGGTEDEEDTPVIHPIASSKTGLQDMLLTSSQGHQTPTPAMQVYGKKSDKAQEPERPPTQPWKMTSITLRNPIIGSVPPGLVMSTTWPRLQDPAPGTSPPPAVEIATPKDFPNGTRKNGRRGEIRVTTQRALHRPQLIDAPTSLPSKKTTLETPLCGKTSGTCEFVGTNQTLLMWEDLRHTLNFAWDMHVYGTGALFILLSVIALINLIGSPILRVSYLPYIIVANALLFAVGILRGVFFLLDPYGTKMKISQPIALVLYNVTFPFMLSAFAALVLLVLKMARLQLLPPKLQSLALLAVIATIHFIVLLSADLLTHLLNPSVNMVLQILSISWGIFLMVGNFVAYYRLRKSCKDTVNETQRVSPAGEEIMVVQTQGRSTKCIFTSSRVLLVSSIFGLLCCGLQVYAILWLYGILGRKNEFSWSWWFLQFWFRIFELALCFSLVFVASHSFCLQCSSNDHTCWSKIISYFCTYKKSDVPEYPNNCYDWTNNIQDRVVNNNINKSIIRNQAENVPLRILKENNETKSGTVFGNNSRSSSPLFKPKPESVFGPKSQNVTMGRSYTSICFEKESMLSLTDLEFRPPSPINLSRSIDEALFREHLVRDSIFLDSSLQYPSYLIRQDSCSSLKECSALNQTVDPLISSDLKMRRCSNPDYTYSLAKCDSMTEVDSPSESLQQSKELPRDVTTEAVASGSSMDSVSKGSIKFSWNPWRHGLSSVESLPLEDTPTTQLLKQGSQPSILSRGSEPEKTLGRRLIERSQTIDSHSIASETIEL